MADPLSAQGSGLCGHSSTRLHCFHDQGWQDTVNQLQKFALLCCVWTVENALLWIGIRIDFALLDLDPDPYWECESVFGSRNKEIDQNLQMSLIYCLSKRFCCTYGPACFMT
jgi:hypothetical protein